MAMNKAERNELESMCKRSAEAKALRYLGVEPPKRVPAPLGQDRFNGWNFNIYKGDVFEAWSTCAVNGVGHPQPEWHSRGGASQGGLALYRTKREALIGLRLAKEAEFARVLAVIDDQISAETLIDAPGKPTSI